MTVDAHITSALQRPIITMATLTGNIIVGTRQREIANVMQRLDVGEGLGVVALLARRAILAFVNIRFRVTTGTIQWARLEGLRWMTVAAANVEVFAVEPKLRHRIVIELIIAGFEVAALAFVTEAAFVHIIISVTALG